MFSIVPSWAESTSLLLIARGTKCWKPEERYEDSLLSHKRQGRWLTWCTRPSLTFRNFVALLQNSMVLGTVGSASWSRRRSWGSAPANTWTAKTCSTGCSSDTHALSYLRWTPCSWAQRTRHLPVFRPPQQQRWSCLRVRSRSLLLLAAGREPALLEKRHLPWRPRSTNCSD
jgi:hypothetical protein